MEQAAKPVLNNSEMGKLWRVFLPVAIANIAIKIHIVGSKYMLWGGVDRLTGLGRTLDEKYNRDLLVVAIAM